MSRGRLGPARAYAVTAGKPPSRGTGADPAFVVEVAAPDKARIRFDFEAKTFMCWCEYGWKARSVASKSVP